MRRPPILRRFLLTRRPPAFRRPRRMPPPRRLPGGRLRRLREAVALALLLLWSGACAHRVQAPRLHEPDVPPPYGQSSHLLKAHLHSGELVAFRSWRENVEDRQIMGVAERFDRDRRLVAGPGPVALPVDSIALLETNRDEVDGGSSLGLTLLASFTVVSVVTAAHCLIDPKACFGSCPTFYLDEEGGGDGGGGERLAAEGFSSSIARALEATDLDDLRSTAAPGRFALRMRNEALETHAVRSVRLHAVPELPGHRVFATPDGRFVVAERMVPASRCAGPEGDCMAAVHARDGVERASLADSMDLAARETLELHFPASAGDRLGLVVSARHSFVSTFLFYQMLAWLGRDAAPFLASLERGDTLALERVTEVMGLLGRLEVEVADAHGVWVPAGEVTEAGPLAADTHLLELPALELPEGEPLRVRLTMTRGFWRVDEVALAELGGTVASVVLEPDSVAHIPGQAEASDSRALDALLDRDRYLVTNPGDHFRIVFHIPDSAGAQRYRLFLESTGYYYEWMRTEWLEEESPARAAMMLFQPKEAFRQLAPAFKELEPRMEEAFWNSRFRREQ